MPAGGHAPAACRPAQGRRAANRPYPGLDAPAHLLADWPVTLLTSPSYATTVCVENYRTVGIVDDPDGVRTALRAYDELTSEALSARDSARLIAQQMETLS
ncbi:Scr1 family TA system antitoxin-like transcriptional regulator [Streptomyces lydicus]|uniref:Scr1 family TA system antitoxin-like transcriptional regulator n=1 Tax=Streptomyces lydicus TaxID=47763 RepID=UPI0037A95A59